MSTIRTFSSNDKTEISLLQKSLTNRMKHDIKTLKSLSFIKQIEKIKLDSFHHIFLRNSFNKNYKYLKIEAKNLRTSDSSIIPQLKILPSLDLHNSFNKPISKNRTLSIGSISTIHNYTTKNNQSKTEKIKKRNKTKIKFLQKFNFNQIKNNKIRKESLIDFSKKSKKILLENYFYLLQENEMKNIKEERKIEVDLMNLEILNLEKMINLIEIYIKSTDDYLNDLYKKIEKEKEIREVLFEKKNEILHETYLLRHRFGRLQRQFEYNLNNKFFLLCVKNKTGLFERFNEEDQNDYKKDLHSLFILSNFNSVQSQFNKKNTISMKGKEKRYSILEENLSSGIKIIKEPKIIFSGPEEFKKKLDLISFNIKNSLIIYNEKQNELTSLRENLKEKKELIEKEEELEKFFEEELNVTENKLKEVKLRNEYLQKYLYNLPKVNKKNNFNLVDLKVFEIYNEINNQEEFKEKIYKYNEKINTLSRLLEIENKINDLIYFKRKQERYNYDKFIFVKKNIDISNRKKANKIAKIKAKEEFQEKLKKIIEKNDKYIYQPYKKINNYYEIIKKKK